METRSLESLRIIPLGGLGEVGMNCMAIEYADEVVIIDCGVTFPSVDAFGVDLVLPDYGWLLENVERISGILLTHGHEDHLGAVPFLLREIDVRVYGTPLTLAILEHKLTEHGLVEECDLVEVEVGERFSLEHMEVEYVHVNHSLPDAAAIVLHTPAGVLLHTGDWRLDHTPPQTQPIDLSRIAALGAGGVLCLLGDSTNVEISGTPISESEVLRQLEAVIRPLVGRVLVTIFSSNAYRLQGLLKIAERLGRRVHVNGRSLQNMLRFASDLGYILAPSENTFIPLGELQETPPDNVLIISTGSQGEPRSSLTRIAHNDHRQIRLSEGDTVIFSARTVPGNEMAVARVQNALWERGIEVITRQDAPVHTTGHAHRDDMELLLNLVRPRHLVPIHGELRMLVKHARLAASLGVQAHVITNGDVLEVDQQGARKLERVGCGRVLVDGTGVGDVGDIVLRDRRQIARAGMIIVFMVLDAQSGEIVAGPDLVQRGVVDDLDTSGVFLELRSYTLTQLADLNPESMRDRAEVAETLRLAVRRFFKRRFQRKPVVIPIVREL